MQTNVGDEITVFTRLNETINNRPNKWPAVPRATACGLDIAPKENAGVRGIEVDTAEILDLRRVLVKSRTVRIHMPAEKAFRDRDSGGAGLQNLSDAETDIEV
jgi:hypothetical protein